MTNTSKPTAGMTDKAIKDVIERVRAINYDDGYDGVTIELAANLITRISASLAAAEAERDIFRDGSIHHESAATAAREEVERLKRLLGRAADRIDYWMREGLRASKWRDDTIETTINTNPVMLEIRAALTTPTPHTGEESQG